MLETLPLEANSDDFVFDNQMLAQAIHFGFRVGEISTPTRYFAEASSINFSRSVRYGLGVLSTSMKYRLHHMRLIKAKIFSSETRATLPEYYHEYVSSPRVSKGSGEIEIDQNRPGQVTLPD